MIQRQLLRWLEAVSGRRQIVHVYGLRQTGKTTLMKHFRGSRPGHLHYPLQNYVVLQRYESDISRWVAEIEEALSRLGREKTLHVFIDEVQKIPDLFQALQGLYDDHKGRAKFWIWGSSARPLKKKRAETLAGRFISRTLYPLSQSEITGTASRVPLLLDLPESISQLDFEPHDNFAGHLERCFERSMLPEPFLCDSDDEARDILDGYQASYIENEIRREHLVADVGTFSRFVRVAASEDGSTVNYSSVAKDLGVSPNTIRTYHDILADTFVTSLINPCSRRLRVQVSKSPKVYFADTGLARFISGERGIPPRNSSRFGRLFENYVVNEILKQREYHNLPWQLSFLRTRHGREVDLVVSEGGRSCAVEIKCKPRVSRSDCKGIEYLMSLDKSISHGVIVSMQGAPLRISENIFNFPAWNL